MFGCIHLFQIIYIIYPLLLFTQIQYIDKNKCRALYDESSWNYYGPLTCNIKKWLYVHVVKVDDNNDQL
jgi:hypothetical protein